MDKHAILFLAANPTGLIVSRIRSRARSEARRNIVPHPDLLKDSSSASRGGSARQFLQP